LMHADAAKRLHMAEHLLCVLQRAMADIDR
jgi:hypothetical protein